MSTNGNLLPAGFSFALMVRIRSTHCHPIHTDLHNAPSFMYPRNCGYHFQDVGPALPGYMCKSLQDVVC